MPQTTNFGFPLWADTPPEGATGKTLRDAVLGEGTGSLANMADKAIAKIKNSVPPVDLENIDFTWDGITAGLTVATEPLSNGHKNSFAYYKVLDTPVSSKIEFLASGKIKYDGILEMGQSEVWPLLPHKESESLYSYSNGNLSGIFGYTCFSVFKSRTAFKSGSETLIFPEVGFYVTKALGSDTFRTESIKTVPTVYDSVTMPGAAVEVTSHKVTSIDENSTDTQYPSAKAVWDAICSAESGNGLTINSVSATPTDGEVNTTVPAKTSELSNNSNCLTLDSSAVTSEESTANKATYIDDFNNPNIDNTHYPTNKAVYDFVVSYVGKQIENKEATVFLPLAEWDGNTDGKLSILGMFYKVSENTYVPDKIVYRYADKASDEAVTIDADYLNTDGVITDLAETYGIYVPTLNAQRDGIMIAKKGGVLPSDVASAMLGVEVPVDVPYEAGTYFSSIPIEDTGTRRYPTEAFYSASVKDYIDSKFEEILKKTSG